MQAQFPSRHQSHRPKSVVTFSISSLPLNLPSFSPSFSAQTLMWFPTKPSSAHLRENGLCRKRTCDVYACSEGWSSLKVQVWEIIHHEMVAVYDLHDRRIQNNTQHKLNINYSPPSLTTQHPVPSEHTHMRALPHTRTHTHAQIELEIQSSQRVIYPPERVRAFWPFGSQHGS